MTFIQPHQNRNIFSVIIVALVIAVLGGTLWIIMAYNKTVDVAHDAATMKAELAVIGAQNTAMSNQLIGMLGSDRLAAFAANGNLVEDKTPRYFALNRSWPLASE